MAENKLKLVLTRPANKSLEAFKEWVMGTVKALGGSNEKQPSENEWESAWKEFWGGDAGKK